MGRRPNNTHLAPFTALLAALPYLGEVLMSHNGRYQIDRLLLKCNIHGHRPSDESYCSEAFGHAIYLTSMLGTWYCIIE